MERKKNKGGRPKIVWEEHQYKTLEGLCYIQATIEEIERVLNIDHKTLDRLCKVHYRNEKGKPMGFSQVKEKHSSTGKMSLRRWQFRSAENGSVPMQIWLGKQYLGQTDKQEMGMDSSNDITINVSPATKEEVTDD